MSEFNPMPAEILTGILEEAAQRLPAAEWSPIAAELHYFFSDCVTEAVQPGLYRLIEGTPPTADNVEQGIRLARLISRAASAMSKGQRDYLWWELWKLLQNRPSLPRDLTVAIDVLLVNELR